jgi:hypothetical protein
MVGWLAMDRALLPSARLYAGLLIVELVVLLVLVAGVIWALKVVARLWTADKPGEGREDALARARGRLGADGRAGTRGFGGEVLWAEGARAGSPAGRAHLPRNGAGEAVAVGDDRRVCGGDPGAAPQWQDQRTGSRSCG